MTETVKSAHVGVEPDAAMIPDLLAEFGEQQFKLIVFFSSPAHDGAQLSAAFAQAHPEAAVLGCTTAGEFDERVTGIGGVAAIGLPASKVTHAVTALADFSAGVDAAIGAALADLEQQLGGPLRELDPAHHVGLVLIDGLSGAEERVNELLGNAAPTLSFVGGSAGDDLAFEQTQVFLGARNSPHGAVLAVLEMAVPFTIAKACSFTPAGRSFTVTRADADHRIVWQLDGRDAAEVYAEAVGVSPAELNATVFMTSPVGLMIDDKPWVRSPQQVVEGGGIKFYCQLPEGMEVELMKSTQMLADTRNVLEQAKAQVGGAASAAIVFNCILRRLEIDADGTQQEFVQALGGIPAAGIHAYGESWLGHINQTLTALVVA